MRYLDQRLASPFKEINLFLEQEISDSVNRNTIGHNILVEDRRAESIPDAIFERLDFLISRVQNEIPLGDNQDPAVAMEKLKSIENTLIDNNYVCSIPYFLVATFAQGLQPKPLSKCGLIYAEENHNRKSHIEKHIDEGFSHVDCDLSSLLYLSISEKLDIPLCMVEVPQHNFVRWKFEDGHYINWDTNYGYNRFTDRGYSDKYGALKAQIDKGTYLSNMSRDNVIGYFCFCRGLTFEGSSNQSEAIKEYFLSIEKYPQSPISRNNLSWKFVTSRDAQNLISGSQALAFARETIAISRTYGYLDTLACVLAELGEFEEAITIETEAYNMNPSPEFEAMIKAFRQRQTWLDIHEA